MTDLISSAEYARLRGCSRPAVSKAIATGRIDTVAGPKGKRLIDVDAANIAWAARTDPTQQERGAPEQFAKTQRLGRESAAAKAGTDASKAEPVGPTLKDAKTRESLARAQMLELELLERSGTLVSKAGVEKALQGKLIALAEHLQEIGDRCAAVFAAETDVTRIYQALAHEHRAALQMLSGAAVGKH